MVKKLNDLFFKHIALRLSDREAYRDWKFVKKLERLPDIDTSGISGEQITFKHSGNAGDFIHSLPTVFAIAKNRQVKILLSLEGKGRYGKKPHPLVDKMLSPQMIKMLKPLLEAQPQIVSCEEYAGQKVDVNLDLFRNLPMDLRKGNNALWHCWTFGAHYNLSKAWLQVKPNTIYKDSIVIARTQRSNQPCISYGFLKKYNRLIFVGVEQEYQLMKQQLPSLQFVPVNDFYELASIILGSKLFIGNASFPYALAEATKARRLLEVYYRSPVVSTYGNNGADFYRQSHFEKLVEEFYNNS